MENYEKKIKKFKKNGIKFKEIEIDEESDFDSSIKCSKNYCGCVGVALYSENEGALLHYSYFPSILKKEIEKYLKRINKKDLSAKVVLCGNFIKEEKKVLEEIFKKNKINYKFLILDSKRDIIFYPSSGKMEIFFPDKNKIEF
ncbi:MAG: hypothetical protein QW117_01990 [Candidatus Pacearchaeota archaeon]